jgi:hypothetical protein
MIIINFGFLIILDWQININNKIKKKTSKNSLYEKDPNTFDGFTFNVRIFSL